MASQHSLVETVAEHELLFVHAVPAAGQPL